MNFTEKLIGQKNYHSLMTAPTETKVDLQSETAILPEATLGEAYHYEGQKKYICVSPKKEVTQQDGEIQKIKEFISAHGFKPADKNQEIEYVFRNGDEEVIRMEFSGADKKMQFIDIQISQA